MRTKLKPKQKTNSEAERSRVEDTREEEAVVEEARAEETRVEGDIIRETMVEDFRDKDTGMEYIREEGTTIEVEAAGDVSENDCEAIVDDATDELDEDVGVNGISVEEEDCPNLEVHFGDMAREQEEASDADSGDDIWDDNNIPDPLSSDDDEEAAERKEMRANTIDSEELLFLGKTFGCAADFKVALLRYSLRTRYDIKLYKSSAQKLGAKCSDMESECPWRVYCSYERRKHKMQIKVYVNEHICLRSGYSKMLKRSSIAMLFEERLRLNPKFSKKEMAEEIKREYNLIVTEEQCAKAKSKLYRERKASHEVHFSRIWDYEAELKRSNPYSTVVIETIPG